MKIVTNGIRVEIQGRKCHMAMWRGGDADLYAVSSDFEGVELSLTAQELCEAILLWAKETGEI